MAVFGDTIRVAQGTYLPDRSEADPDGSCIPGPCDRDATFALKDGVEIRGGYAGVNSPNPNLRDVVTNETILSGDLAGDDGPDFQNNGENSYNVVTADGVNQTAVLNGFTISAGNANVGGGAMVVINASPTVLLCRLVENAGASRGGAVQITEQGASAPKFVDCSFIENAVFGQGGAAVFSFSISNQNSPTFINCAFVGNTGGQHGGASTLSAGVPCP